MAEEDNNRFEMLAGLTLAILAAVLAVTDLGGGKYGDDEIIGTNEKANAYAWYQSKSIKQSIVEQELELLNSLEMTGTIDAAHAEGIKGHKANLEADIARYKSEKKEILEGSTAVGAEGQVLEKDGQKGQIKGTEEWEAELAVLGAAGDKFDLATLFLQMSLVLGAVSIVLKAPSTRTAFYGGMVLCGVIGTGFMAWAFSIVMA